MKRKSDILLILLSVFVLSMASCTGMKHGNFHKRKYLKLKNSPEFVEVKEESEDVYFDDDIEQEEEFLIDNIESNSTGIDGLETNVIPELDDQKEYREEFSDSFEPIEFSTEPEKRERPNFNTRTEEEQNRSIIQFNRLFNNGLPILIMGIVLLTAGILVFMFSGIDFLGWVGIASGLIFLVVAWIISMVAVQKVRKLDLSTLIENDKRLKTKIILARVLATIGVISTLFPLLWVGAIILLILWLAKII